MTDLQLPPLRPLPGGWERYEAPITLRREEAGAFEPGAESPEAAVLGFYASWMRGDERYREFLPPPERWRPVLARKLAKMARWRFEAVSLLSRRLRGERRCAIKLRLELEVDGRHRAGTDDVSLERGDDGRWRVLRPPT